MLYKTIYESSLGNILIVSDENNIIGLWFEGQKYFLANIKDDITQKDDLPILQSAKLWLDQYFAGQKPNIANLKLAPRGNDFRLTVWKILCEIPYGQLTTYGEIAKKVAIVMNKESMSAQAVGGAVGHNPISIIIPCHRVVGSHGSLTGYAGGIDKKIKLLQLEGVDTKQLMIPKKGTALSYGNIK
ncbi:MAG: methylated-DNA--[protein]-cysteine S-methyltransferase [Longibaculum muris]|uniref:Methylated-DNA--protein-cysteine methyltransferase n=1 Tax=Longibaculum muris TaxID=1796628 RepID=A0A4R3YHS0_9FIRM|nr:methylated-DNA--[protein]-cysteine S-methyltransferase [Longibaculum muris]MBS5370220.1 methylated-DNA--[protein]-cysteine S-methyltransferase [Coprobacillus cateniformis]MCR1889196.1 methylated-DNA--[protein]-cysteine S-methyltransferase [Longibaculum muris]MED9810515.1 methylated-DNA--[protein]-cysteine S-methyltransferase [Longibaculum muris]TCV91766.1 methylated-DNA-[protein]-cysteine S-methyltransferase [Longibaculum muris]